MRRQASACAFALLAALWSAAPAHAGALRLCDQATPLNAEQRDLLLRFGAIVKTVLEDSDQDLALIARSGLDLGRFGVRYSHAGLSLKASLNTPWSVRQLYYACDEGRPRVFDQGMAGFVLGLNDPTLGYVSVVLLPAAAAAMLETTVLDDRLALQALGPAYSANAYAFGLRYQNCNQWVVEMMATAWGRLERSGGDDDLRAQAQRWLAEQNYQPSVIEVGWPLMWLGPFIPWVHNDDHPQADVEHATYRTSLPASIEAFVRATVPGATRVEFCHAGRRVVIHRGWDAIAEDCQPGEHDTVVTLE